jgi:pimeloyl-ACP methyl ester carboxylesterase
MESDDGDFVDSCLDVRGFGMVTRVSNNQTQHRTIPLVLVHGLGVSSWYLLPTARLLAIHFRTLLPDLPGFGRSDKPPEALSIKALSEILSLWLDAQGFAEAVFLGNSLGCQIIVDLALRFPEKVRSAILVSPTVDIVGRTMSTQLMRGIRDLAMEPWSLWPYLASQYWSTGTRRLYRTFQIALDDPVETKFTRMHMPTLVVRGGRDPIVPQRWAQEIVRSLPHGELAVIPNGTHAANYSAPGELARVAMEFLKQFG